MKLLHKIVYFSLALTAVLLIQTIEQSDQNLDVKQYKADLCADFFQDGSHTLVSQSDRDNAASIQSSFYDENIRSSITKLVNDQEFDTSIITNLLKYIIPWAVFLLISLFGWIFYCSYCICDKKCPPSQCCKRDYSQQKLSKKEFYIPIAFAIILNLLILCASIVGLVYAGDIVRGAEAAQCSLMSLFSDVIYSYSGESFAGLYSLSTSISSISNQLNDFQQNLTTTFGSGTAADLENSKTQLITENDNLKRSASQAIVPILDGSTETYLSSMNFVDYILMSESDSSSSTYSSNYQTLFSSSNYSPYLICKPQPALIDTYYTAMIVIAQGLEDSSSSITDGSFDTGALTSGNDTVNTFINDIESAATSLYDSTKPIGDYGSYGTLALTILFAVSLGLSVISIICVILMLLLKLYKIRGILHFSWSIYVIIMILCFLVALVLNPAVVISAEICYYLDQFSSSYTFYSEGTLISSQDTKDIVATCLFPTQNGKTLYQVMNLENATAPLNTFTAKLKVFTDSYSKLSESTTTYNTAMNNNYKAITNVKDGSAFDVPSASYTTYSDAFSKFNSFSSNTGCVELATIKCSDSRLPIKTSSDSSDTVTYNPNCWHPTYLVSNTPSCSEQNSLTETTTLKSQYSKQSTLWSNPASKEAQLITDDGDLQANFVAYMDQINYFTTNATSITTQLDTLLNGLDCTFLQGSFQNIIDGLCVIMIPGIGRTLILILIVGFGMFFGSLANCCVGLRAYRIKEYGFLEGGTTDPQVIPQNYNYEEQNLKQTVQP